MQRSSVLLPEPLGPSTQTTSPLPTLEVDAAQHLAARRSACATPSSFSIASAAIRAGPRSGRCPPRLPGAGSAATTPAAALKRRLLARDQPVDQPGERDRHDQEHERAEDERRSR